MSTDKQSLEFSPQEAEALYPVLMAYGAVIGDVEYGEPSEIANLHNLFGERGHREELSNPMMMHFLMGKVFLEASFTVLGQTEPVTYIGAPATLVERSLVWCKKNPEKSRELAIVRIVDDPQPTISPMASLMLKQMIVNNVDQLFLTAHDLADRL